MMVKTSGTPLARRELVYVLIRAVTLRPLQSALRVNSASRQNRSRSLRVLATRNRGTSTGIRESIVIVNPSHKCVLMSAASRRTHSNRNGRFVK